MIARPRANGRFPAHIRNLDSPHWRNLLRNPFHRCLVPVSSSCEWSGKKGSKAENWFSLRDQSLFAFAGCGGKSMMTELWRTAS